MNKKEMKKIITYYDKLIEVNPNDDVAYNNRGLAKYKLGDYRGAISDYNKAIDIMPNYAMAYYNKGVAERKLKEK